MPGDNGTPNGSAASEKALPQELRALMAEFYESAKVPEAERKTFHKLAKLRLKNRELREENDRLMSTGPKDGGRVLTKDEAAEFDAFKALKLKPADITALVDDHGKLKSKSAERDAEELYVDAADALGFDNLPLFMRTMAREKLHLEFKEERVRDEESGKVETVRVPMVRPMADDKAQLVTLEDYLEENLGAEFIAAFQSEPADQGEGDEEGITAGVGTESFTRRVERVSAGDRDARRTAAKTGVAIPVTRGARPQTGAAKQDKKEKEAFEEKAKSGNYAML